MLVCLFFFSVGDLCIPFPSFVFLYNALSLLNTVVVVVVVVDVVVFVTVVVLLLHGLNENPTIYSPIVVFPSPSPFRSPLKSCLFYD